jgi:hypothetical protein
VSPPTARGRLAARLLICVALLALASPALTLPGAASPAIVLDYDFSAGVVTNPGCDTQRGSSPASSSAAGIIGGLVQQTASGCDTGWKDPGFTTNAINSTTNFVFFSFTVTQAVSIDTIGVSGWTNPFGWSGAPGY